MKWEVSVDEDGVITLPPDLIAELGWTSETLLRWTDLEGGISLGPVDLDEPGEQA